jgi:hypothetical protein
LLKRGFLGWLRGERVHVPVDRDHRFRRKVITGSGGT